MFISPFIVGFVCFISIPMVMSFVFSFTQYDILTPPEFVGLKNYISMFTEDRLFWKTFGVTMFYVLFSVPLRLLMALVVALLLVRPGKLSAFYRTVFYLPSIIGSSVAIAILWKRMFASNGMINALLGVIGIESNSAWLGKSQTAIWTLILLAVWQFGSSMLIFWRG